MPFDTVSRELLGQIERASSLEGEGEILSRDCGDILRESTFAMNAIEFCR